MSKLDSMTFSKFGGSKNFLILTAIQLAIGVWLFSRLGAVNPAILGDEYLYSLNSRKTFLWEPPIAGNFSNDLFNLVYHTTNLCGPAFYSCVKGLNILFFLSFAIVIFTIAFRFLPFAWSVGLSVATSLSPLSVYTSMFLPESLYFLLIAVAFSMLLDALKSWTSKSWVLVGFVVGLGALTKPHMWLTFLAFVIVMVTVGLSEGLKLVRIAKAVAYFSATAFLTRILVGLLLGGPASADIFGVYLNSRTIPEGLGVPTADPLSSTAASQPSRFETALTLFPDFFGAQFLAIVGITALPLLALAGALIAARRSDAGSAALHVGLAVFIWLSVLSIAIALFTGWVTATGDDHTGRVLLRYFDFLFVIVPLAGVVMLHSSLHSRVGLPVRWALTLLAGWALTIAFSGFFATLQIQIADAPSLAGLVVNWEVFSFIAVASFVGLILFATFPKLQPVYVGGFMIASLMLTGFQAQDQYRILRGTDAPADIAGKTMARELSLEDLERISILTDTRFNATLAGIWMDIPDIHYDLLQGPAQIPVTFFEPARPLVLIIGVEVNLVGDQRPVMEGEGFKLIEIISGNPVDE